MTNHMKMMRLSIDANNEHDIAIHEDELVEFTDAGLRKLRISREELKRVFAEGQRLMQSVKPSDEVWPCAYQDHGKWNVYLSRFDDMGSPLTSDQRTWEALS